MSANRVDVASITRERLDGWAALLIKDHATPAVLIGVGHDEVSGSISVCLPEDLTFIAAAQLLEAAAARLRGRT